ncbi:DUF2303 family protein [Pseudooceanicola algae]|uniref:DUF2303 family protein n=1 Tax=Pseudooceanicola algae TaxID=1537215 RepID=A0A418SDA3_9RHOB|nr:DUF2303 family protein [Pseudooceanicola algae]QPM89356.1 hypothetical protein PSAL_005720 [Pseudooceanicola algae]
MNSTTPDTRLDPRGALNASIDGARLSNPIIDHPDGRRHAFVPSGYSLQDVTDPFKLPPMIKQAITFDDRDSLTTYVNRFCDHRSIIIADLDAGTICAALDWHTGSEEDGDALKAQPACHKASLRLRLSEEFKRWDEIEGPMHSQEEFAMFIEENVADVSDPDHSTLLEICRELEATQGATFKSGIRLENGDRVFKYENETRVANQMVVPTEIGLSIPIYHGEEPVELKAKFRFRVTPEGLRLGLRWHRVEYQRQATFRAMAFQVSENTGLPVMFGRT